jgi:DNA-binding beta-propeller fold protein YncE
VRSTLTTAALTAAATALGACGSAAVSDLPPAAQPARSPALTATPAGRVVRVGAHPEALGADPLTHRFVVAERAPDQLRFVDARHGTTVGRAPILRPARPRGSEAYNNVFVLPGESVLVAPRPAIAATVIGGRIFVADARAGTVSVSERGRPNRRLRVAAEPSGLSPADGGRLLAVVSSRERVLELYDPRTLARVARVGAGVGPTHVAAEADRLYVTDTTGGALLVFELRPRLRLDRRVDLPGAPYGLTVDPVRHRLWVTLTARNELVSLVANGRPRPILRVPTVRQPDDVAVESALGTVAITGRSAGVLQLIAAGMREFAGAVLRRPARTSG